MEKMRNLILRCCFNKIFSTKSKKEDTIYMGIIYMSFLSRNLLCINIYTMPSFMWGNELFSILKWWLYLYCISFSFLTYKVTYSKNIKIFRRNAKFISAIGFLDRIFRNLFVRLSYPKLYVEDQIFAIYSATIYGLKNFCPQGKWTSYLQIWLNTRKIPKVSIGIKFGKQLTFCVLDSLTSMIECC